MPFQVPPDLIFMPTLENYEELFVTGSFGRYFFNSFVVCVLSIILGAVGGDPSAYIFARCEFRFKQGLFLCASDHCAEPRRSICDSLLYCLQRTGIIGYLYRLDAIYFASNLGIIVWSLRAFMEDIPISLEEAARIDGCSLLQTLFRISIPLATPASPLRQFYHSSFRGMNFCLRCCSHGRRCKLLRSVF